MTTPAFIVGLGPNGYGLARSLLINGVPVVGFHYNDSHFGRSSRLLSTRALDLRAAPDAVAAVLRSEAQAWQTTPVLFAASDMAAYLFSKSHDQLVGTFAFHWLSADTLSRVFDKAEMTRVCRHAGIRAPQTRVTTPDEDVRETARACAFPCVVKPVRSFGTSFPAGVKAFVAQSAEDLVAFHERHPGTLGTTLWQEIIDGPDDAIYQCNLLIGRSGDVSGACTVRKLRQYPAGYGNMSFGVTEANDIVTAESLKLIRCLSYRGFASVEFKRRASDGHYYFIELNARLPRYGSLFAKANVNLPFLGYRDLTLSSACVHRATEPQRERVHWLIAGEDFRGLQAVPGRPVLKFCRWIRSLGQARAFAWWNVRDPAPFIRALAGPSRPQHGAAFVHRPDRACFDRQYDHPDRVEITAGTFRLHDIRPERPTSSVPILFCPGWMQNPENHRETIYALYRAGRRIVFPDALHGIEALPRADLPMPELRKAALLLAVLRDRDIVETDAVAHSEGAINFAIAATMPGAPCFRNVVLVSPAGLTRAHHLLASCWRTWQECRDERRRQRRNPPERQLLRDWRRRRLYLRSTVKDTIAEASATVRADIRELLRLLRRRGTSVAIVHGVNDRLFPMGHMLRFIDGGIVDGFYSVHGGHQQILLEPSTHGSLVSDVLLALERKRSVTLQNQPGASNVCSSIEVPCAH